MDDSDQDFVDLCSKPLKRVRKKPVESRPPRKAEHRPCTQDSEGDRRRRNNRRDGDHGCKATGSQPVVHGGAVTLQSGGDAGSLAVLSAAAAAGPGSGLSAETGLTAKDKVLMRMQQFKRASPQRMAHRYNGGPLSEPQRQEPPEPSTSALHLDNDEALALRLQRELDREAGQAESVDLEDRGLFFCQICHRDVSHMTPEGRTQHLNRCLDRSEESAPALPPPPPPPGVPDCPICGKRFKSQKSRSAHLKRCSSDMGVSPAVLRQVLQRQAEETQAVTTGNTLAQTGGVKRKGPSKPGNAAKKKPRKKTDPLDEDTMVALALSSSLLEQERELQTEPAAVSHISLLPTLKWRTDAGTGRGRKRKGAAPRPPPLLLVQDAQEALMRLQERVSALLLRTRPPSPPTPTRCPSTLPAWSGAAPLWQKSTLLNGSSNCLSDFYTPELKEFITPWESARTNAASSNTGGEPDSSLQPVSAGTPVTETRASVLSASSQSSAAPSTPGTGQNPVGSQALQDLMELAEDGMTLTQCGYKNKQSSGRLSTKLQLSGFVLEEAEEQADLCVSGFLPETAHTLSEDTHRKPDEPRADEERGGRRTAALCRLASDLSSMVNNPQLSDLQLQVDSGEVYFAHSFMVYARCPLLAEMVHESGFRVQEADAPAAQRVLMSDVPGQAVFTLLQYLYTAHCSIPASLQPHVLELASRFDLQELQQLCETEHVNQDENASDHTDQAFMELLRSMWNEEDEEDGGADTDGGDGEEGQSEEGRKISDVTSGEREMCEEQVNEEELEEIYEFAATQRKREEEEKESAEEEEEEEKEDDGDNVFTELMEPTRRLSEKNPKPSSQPEPDPGLDRSYSRLFSGSWGVYEEEDPPDSSPPKTRTPQSQKHQSPHKPALELSGRTLLLSSPSVVDDLSTSPRPSTSNLPMAGLSPGQVSGGGDSGPEAEKCLPFKPTSQGRRSLSLPVSPASPAVKEEPELIVLSDSSEDMEVDVAPLSSCSPSTPSRTIGNLRRFTHIKPQSIPKTTPPAGRRASACDQSPAGCSPEVSWLIPSTPVQPDRSLRSSSTQTKSSMCRTQLFPRGDASSSSSSPAPPLDKRPETSSGARADPTEGGVPRLQLDDSSHLSSSPKTVGSCDASKNTDAFAVPQNQHEASHRSNSSHHHPLEASFKRDTPLHPQPCSSTPLHTELKQPLAPLADSPLIHSTHDQRRWSGQDRHRSPSESPDKTELASFHLSPWSDPSSSHRGLQSSQRDGQPSSESQRRVEYSSDKLTGAEASRSQGGEAEDMCCEEEQEEGGGGAEHSFQHSFVDEPPIAFSDSWDACIHGNAGRFSLRLEDSGGSNQHERSETSRPSPSAERPPGGAIQSPNARGRATDSSPARAHSPQPPTGVQAPTAPAPDHNSLLESRLWDSWEEEEEELLPLSQRLNPAAQLKTPKSSHVKKRRSMVPITPMPQYSDMDTPELKNKLNRFGVRPLPKRQMILKLKEIHQYTHQLVSSSDSEDEAPSAGRTAQVKPTSAASSAGSRPVSCAQTVKFKEPQAPAAISPLKRTGGGEGEEELLSASQGSNTSSTAASESERSNPELCLSSDGNSDSDGGISASQAANRLQDRLQAVRSFILSDPRLYNQILQYQPLVLTQLQERLKAAGIRLGAAKLVDYLDSQCITFTTAKPGQPAPSRRRGHRTARGAKATGEKRAYKKKAVTVTL